MKKWCPCVAPTHTLDLNSKPLLSPTAMCLRGTLHKCIKSQGIILCESNIISLLMSNINSSSNLMPLTTARPLASSSPLWPPLRTSSMSRSSTMVKCQYKHVLKQGWNTFFFFFFFGNRKAQIKILKTKLKKCLLFQTQTSNVPLFHICRGPRLR